MKPVSVDEIVVLLERCQQTLRHWHGDVDLGDADYYWSIAEPERRRLDRVPEPVVGSLADDYHGTAEGRR